MSCSNDLSNVLQQYLHGQEFWQVSSAVFDYSTFCSDLTLDKFRTTDGGVPVARSFSLPPSHLPFLPPSHPRPPDAAANPGGGGGGSISLHVGMDVDSSSKGMPSNTGGVMPSAGQEGEGSSVLRGERAVDFTQVSLHPRSHSIFITLNPLLY